MAHNWGKFAQYIQMSLFEGKQPDENGYYVFSRKELADGAGMSVSAFDNNKRELISYFSSWCNLKNQGNYNEYAKEMLYIDVKYENGKLMFKRNPLTLSPELQHLWALPPLTYTFAYDCYDDFLGGNASRVRFNEEARR